MTEKDSEIAKALADEFETMHGVDSVTHKKHHDFIDELTITMRDKRVFWTGVRKQVTGWGIIMALTGTGLLVNEWFQHVFRGK